MSDKCSEAFNQALEGYGTYVSAVCDFCGRTHFFSGDTTGWEDAGGVEALEEMQKKADAEPDKYVDWGEVSVSLGDIAGKQYIIGCPCNELAKYENFIWNHRILIMNYYKNQHKAMQENADRLGGQIKESDFNNT